MKSKEDKEKVCLEIQKKLEKNLKRLKRDRFPLVQKNSN